MEIGNFYKSLLLFLISDKEELLQQLHQANETCPRASTLHSPGRVSHESSKAFNHRKHHERAGIFLIFA